MRKAYQSEKLRKDDSGKKDSGKKEYIGRYLKASLTVEAALVLPVFLYMMLVFLYFIQVFAVQEQVQSAITKMGLNLSKTAYVFKDFSGLENTQDFDFSIFGEEYDFNLGEIADQITSSKILKLYAEKYLNTNQITHSCIIGGFEGISFEGSSLLNGNDYIDIIVSYQVKFPVKIFIVKNMRQVQRVRLRSWTGTEAEPAYQIKGEKQEKTTVYIADTGTVYHQSADCSHIRLSVKAVRGLPTGLHNENGAGYYPCETCCKGDEGSLAIYYITSDGTRYHTRRDCSRIKRSVKEIPLSQIGNRTPCKRCYD